MELLDWTAAAFDPAVSLRRGWLQGVVRVVVRGPELAVGVADGPVRRGWYAAVVVVVDVRLLRARADMREGQVGEDQGACDGDAGEDLQTG